MIQLLLDLDSSMIGIRGSSYPNVETSKDSLLMRGCFSGQISLLNILKVLMSHYWDFTPTLPTTGSWWVPPRWCWSFWCWAYRYNFWSSCRSSWTVTLLNHWIMYIYLLLLEIWLWLRKINDLLKSCNFLLDSKTSAVSRSILHIEYLLLCFCILVECLVMNWFLVDHMVTVQFFCANHSPTQFPVLNLDQHTSVHSCCCWTPPINRLSPSSLSMSVYPLTMVQMESTSTFCETIAELEGFFLTQMYDHVIITGDFNVDYAKVSPNCTILESFMQAFDLIRGDICSDISFT